MAEDTGHNDNPDEEPLSSEELLRRAREGLGSESSTDAETVPLPDSEASDDPVAEPPPPIEKPLPTAAPDASASPSPTPRGSAAPDRDDESVASDHSDAVPMLVGDAQWRFHWRTLRSELTQAGRSLASIHFRRIELADGRQWQIEKRHSASGADDVAHVVLDEAGRRLVWATTGMSERDTGAVLLETGSGDYTLTRTAASDWTVEFGDTVVASIDSTRDTVTAHNPVPISVVVLALRVRPALRDPTERPWGLTGGT
jgi:hypothetical protein